MGNGSGRINNKELILSDNFDLTGKELSMQLKEKYDSNCKMSENYCTFAIELGRSMKTIVTAQNYKKHFVKFTEQKNK